MNITALLKIGLQHAEQRGATLGLHVVNNVLWITNFLDPHSINNQLSSAILSLDVKQLNWNHFLYKLPCLQNRQIHQHLVTQKKNQLRGAYDKFPDFFVWAFKIVIDSWKFTMLLLYILWDDWPIFMISASNEQLQQQLEYTLLKPGCHSWWISKMQSDTLEERYVIKFCFKLGKECHRNVWNASDCFSTVLHESSISFWVA